MVLICNNELLNPGVKSGEMLASMVRKGGNRP